MGWVIACSLFALVAGAGLTTIADRAVAAVWAAGAVLGLLMLFALGAVGLVLKATGVLA